VTSEVPSTQGLLDREYLVASLDEAVTRRVTVISATAGSGKTSLLRAWAERFSGARRVAFVSVERDEQDPERFWSRVLEETRVPDASDPRELASGILGDDPVEVVVSELAEQDGELVLIIDDLHELKSTDALAQLELLLERLPSSTRVVLSSRRDPPLRLHRLRLADELAEMRAGDLRFSEDETRELLVVSGVSLSEEGAAALHERTEGWAAGLRLATISLGRHADPERFVAEFSGTDRAIGEYLMAEMLEGQPMEVQRMMLRTSLVDRINGELADLLADRQGSEQVLLELEDANAFVVSLDPGRTSFRYHHLLADFLRLELRRTSADEVPDLHRRAAGWFAEQGDVVEAVRHTQAAGDWPEAARLLADHLFSLTLDGNEAAIAGLLGSFPEGLAADLPELALAHAAVQLSQGRLDEAAGRLAVAESHVEGAPPDRQPRLEVAIASLRLALARRSGRFTDVIEQVDLLEASVREESGSGAMSSELRGAALMNLGIVEMWSGRLADADRHLAEGAELARVIDRPYLEVACLAHRCFASKLVPVSTARERGEAAVELAGRHGYEERPIIAPALAAVGGIAVWRGEFDESDRWLVRAWEVAEPGADPAAAVFIYVTTGMLRAGRQEHRAALDQFAAAARTQALLTGVHALAPRITGWLASTQARLGMLAEAHATIEDYTAGPERMGAVHAIDNARAVIRLTEGDAAGALEALNEVRDGTQGVHAFTLVETHVLAGIAHLDQGDRDAAAAAVEAALAAAEPDRLLFPFAMVDARELLEALPRHATAHGALLTDAVNLLGGMSAPGVDRELLAESEELSPGELRVLRYLPTNLTRPEIADELYVSVNTVNTHIRNIYAKLGVRDRSSAVRHARDLRLLSTGRA
jgi:LuxR family transcriptional regulator, maltose regulon positive regulatory protein